MATRRVTVRSCDTCGAEPAEPVIVTTPETGRRSLDLCGKHRAPLVELAQGGRSGDRRVKRSYTRAEVEALANRKARSK